MYNCEVVLFIEFLKNHNDVLQNLNSEKLNLEFIENKIVSLAKENGFNVNSDDILNYLNEILYHEQESLGDEFLEKISGGKLDNKFVGLGLLALMGITGIANNTAFAINSANSSSSISIKESTPKKVIKTIKNMWNNVLSKDELEYYQSKIGSDYKITSPQGISGAHATAYKLEDTHGKRFILKIPNNPQNAAHWIQNQRKTQENIHKYYSDYKGSLKIPNYIKISDDFVIEENLGKSIDSETLENFDEQEREKFINGLAEFLSYTHKKEKGKISPYRLGHEGFFTLKDAYDYLNNAGALNSEEQKLLTDLITHFEKRDTSDEVSALAHTDIRIQNIVYDFETKIFGLIDFETLNTDAPIYYDFTSGTIGAFGIPYDLCYKIIDRYNDISDLKVDKEKIKIFHKLGTMYELCTCAKFRDNRSKEEICTQIWNNGIKKRFEEIDKGFLNLI